LHQKRADFDKRLALELFQVAEEIDDRLVALLRLDEPPHLRSRGDIGAHQPSDWMARQRGTLYSSLPWAFFFSA
jgi:hypothetical protein